MEKLFWFARPKISEINGTESSEVVQNSQPEYPNGKCVFHLLFLLVPDLSTDEMSVEIEHGHPMEISIRGFDASHLLPPSTNRFFQLNGKKPTFFNLDLNERIFNVVSEMESTYGRFNCTYSSKQFLMPNTASTGKISTLPLRTVPISGGLTVCFQISTSPSGHGTHLYAGRGSVQWLAQAGGITITWPADWKTFSSLARAPVLNSMATCREPSWLGGIKPLRSHVVSSGRSASRTSLRQSSFRPRESVILLLMAIAFEMGVWTVFLKREIIKIIIRSRCSICM